MEQEWIEMLRWRYRAWRYRHRLEPAEIGLLLRHLRPGDAALDVGAHKGAYTWWMRAAVGPSGRVDAFEPQPGLAARPQRRDGSADYVNNFWFVPAGGG